jgi:hypothetical protein
LEDLVSNDYIDIVYKKTKNTLMSASEYLFGAFAAMLEFPMHHRLDPKLDLFVLKSTSALGLLMSLVLTGEGVATLPVVSSRVVGGVV